jgi:hypothetical protein
VGCSLSGAKNRVRLGLEKLSAMVDQQDRTGPAIATTAIKPHPPSMRKETRE